MVVGKSLTSRDKDTFLCKLATLGQLTLAGKPNITLQICLLNESVFLGEIAMVG